MLTALRLGNFKAFGETQTIPIRPLTLIFGANSAGKSSLIHGLLFAHEANRTGNLDVHRTELGGDSVDLGGLWQFAHDMGQPVEWAVEIDVRRSDGLSAEGLSAVKRFGVCSRISAFDPTSHMILSPTLPCIASYGIEADGASLLRASSQNGLLRVEHLDQDHVVFQGALQLMRQFERASKGRSAGRSTALHNAITDLVSRLVLVNKLLPDSVSERGTLATANDGAEPSPLQRKPDQTELIAAARFLVPRAVTELLANVRETVAAELGQLSYLGPFRSYLPRRFIFDQDQDPNWLAGGGHAYGIAKRDLKVREAVNNWLGDAKKLSTPYELVAEHLWRRRDLQACAPEVALFAAGAAETGDADEIQEHAWRALADIEYEVDDGSYSYEETSHIQIMSLIDKRTNARVSHRDVGIGISQILPVLVLAYASKNRLVAIEQPEIHLHPALQAELADVFIDSALGERKNRFILETHSEHLILRVMRRMRETFERCLPEGVAPVRPADVAVLYVEPTDKGSIVREMPLNERGELVKAWPGGFFEEGLREMLP